RRNGGHGRPDLAARSRHLDPLPRNLCASAMGAGDGTHEADRPAHILPHPRWRLGLSLPGAVRIFRRFPAGAPCIVARALSHLIKRLILLSNLLSRSFSFAA